MIKSWVGTEVRAEDYMLRLLPLSYCPLHLLDVDKATDIGLAALARGVSNNMKYKESGTGQAS